MSTTCESAAPEAPPRQQLRQLCYVSPFARSVARSVARSIACPSIRKMTGAVWVLVIFLTCALTASRARAAITVNSVDESRVSSVEGVGSATVTIYGGTAGACASSNGTTTTCSSCTETAGTDTGLRPCNDRRINPSLIVSITVTSSTVATGYPAIAAAGSGATGSAAGTILQQSPNPTGAVSKGSSATINIPWSTICANLYTTATGNGGSVGVQPTNCFLTNTNDSAQATFYVGIKAVNDSTAFGTTDDYAQITIALRSGDIAAMPSSLAPTSGNGITYYEFDSGDNKGTIKSLKSTDGTGFPNYENIKFRWVRVLFEERSPTNNDLAWSKINQGSPHVDLEINSAATDINNLNLSPVIVTDGTGHRANGDSYSVSISNDHAYDTKVAVVDSARNVEFYTPSANDTACDNASSLSPNTNGGAGSGVLECHTIRPAIVVGVLANKVNCFIATASYGSPMAVEVDTFRLFRDTYLIPSKFGIKFVRWYYNEGPRYAHFIADNETYRSLARGGLWLPLQFAKISLSYGLAAGLSFLAFLLIAPLAFLTWAVRRRRSPNIHA